MAQVVVARRGLQQVVGIEAIRITECVVSDSSHPLFTKKGARTLRQGNAQSGEQFQRIPDQPGSLRPHDHPDDKKERIEKKST